MADPNPLMQIEADLAKVGTHTPGPWRVGNRQCVVCDTEIKQFKTGDKASLRAYGGHLVAESIARENLAIISAAPEMLAALEEIANTFDMTWRPGCIERRAGDIARAAIAKARGKT